MSSQNISCHLDSRRNYSLQNIPYLYSRNKTKFSKTKFQRTKQNFVKTEFTKRKKNRKTEIKKQKSKGFEDQISKN